MAKLNIFQKIKDLFNIGKKRKKKKQKNKISIIEDTGVKALSPDNAKPAKKEVKLEDIFEVTEKPKRIKTSDEILEERNKIRKILMDKIKKDDKKPSTVLNNIYYLEAYISDIVEENPELEETALAELAKEKKKLESGIYRDERIIDSLIKEFKQSTIRTASSDNVPYQTGIGSDLNAGLYIEAIYRAFKDEVAAQGVDNKQFRRALSKSLKQEPYELYEEYTTSNGKTARSRQLKSPREIIEMSVGITLLHSYK